MMTVITAATSEAARAKLEDYRSCVSEKGALVFMSGWTGVDLSRYRLTSRSATAGRTRRFRASCEVAVAKRGSWHIYPEGRHPNRTLLDSFFIDESFVIIFGGNQEA